MKRFFVALISFLCIIQANSQTLEGNRYHGMAEINFFHGNDGIFKDGNNALGISASTSHGYQITPNYFIGLGLAWQIHFMENLHNIKTTPVFVNFRANLNKKRISPFVDAKVGYSVENDKGVYIAPSVGVRFGIHNDLGLYISLGYTAQGYKYSYDDLCNDDNKKEIKPFTGFKHSFVHNFAITAGIDF